MQLSDGRFQLINIKLFLVLIRLECLLQGCLEAGEFVF